jgi:PAS domain S-box-containing protein
VERKPFFKNILKDQLPLDSFLYAILLALLIAIFSIDLLTPMGYAVSTLYLLPVVLTWWLSAPTYSLFVLSLVTVLTTLGGLYSPPTSPQLIDIVNRLIGVVVLWSVGLIIHHIKFKELKLQKSERNLRDVIDNTPVMIWGAGTDGLCSFFNKPWLDFTGRTMEQELGNGWSEGVHPEDLPECLATYRAAVAKQQPFNIEYRLRCVDGSYRWIWDQGFPQFDFTRTYVGYLGCCADITDRKSAENVLRRMQDELEIQVTERTSQLEKIIDVLQTNVAEREAAERLLRRREEQFRTFMDHLQGFAWIKDESGCYLFANRYFIKTFGLDENRITGYTDAELFSPEVAAQFRTNDRWVIDNNRDLETIETFVLNNEMRYGLATKFPIRYGHKKQLWVAGLAIDITERIRKEELLTRQAQIIDQIHDAVIAVDLEQSVTSWNKGAEQLFGYSSKEALGKPISFIYPKEHHELFQQEIFARLNQMGHHSVEVQLKKQNGEKFFAYLALSLLRNSKNTVVGMIGYSKDITERKKTEEALRSREADLELALDAGQMGTWNWNMATDEATWSDQVPSLFGMRSENFSRTFNNCINYVHPDDRQQVMDAIENAISNQAPFEMEHRCIWPDGTIHWLAGKGKVIWNDDGPARLIGTLMDITERKKAESRLEMAYTQLRTLAKSLVEAEEEERGRLSRELHDEFAQSLTGLTYSLARLGRQLVERFEPPYRKFFEDDIRSMESLVNGMILSTRRIATGLRPSILDQLGLIAALHWLVQDFESRLKIPCQMFIGEDIAEQPFNSTLSITIFRITQELLTNVARHACASTIAIEIVTHSHHLVLTMHDNGRGITEEEACNPKSFGLKGIRERVALLGGEFEIHGLPGEGTSIQVRISNVP